MRVKPGGSASRLATPLVVGLMLASVGAPPALAQKNYGPGVSDTEIKIGQTMPYSGPASSYGTLGRASAAYYRMVNEQGGINGRRITLISLDDGYSPPKTVEQARRLVEQEGVLAIFGSLGTPTNIAIQRYLNEHKVPQLFAWSGAARFRDPQNYPWSMGGDLSFIHETSAFAAYVLKAVPNAKIAVLYQNDDYGKDHLTGLRQGLGADATRMIVKLATYESTDATIDSQVIELSASGADVLLTIAIPKFTAQAIRKIYEIGWKPMHFIAYPAASIPTTLQPAGLEKSVGVISAEFIKQPGDPAWANDQEMIEYLTFMKKYDADADPNDKLAVLGYYQAAAVVQLLKECGDELTRENLMRHATHMQQFHAPMLLPGITLTTTPTDYAAIKQMRLQRFDGRQWVPIGGIVGE
jgi:branched-chain amino acid transport system substrate-binding protein